LQNLKQNESRTRNSNFLLRNETGAVSMHVANFNNNSETQYLSALGTHTACSGILYSVKNC